MDILEQVVSHLELVLEGRGQGDGVDLDDGDFGKARCLSLFKNLLAYFFISMAVVVNMSYRRIFY